MLEPISVDLPISFFLCVFTRKEILKVVKRLWNSIPLAGNDQSPSKRV